MKLYDAVFYFSAFFLIGVFLRTSGLGITGIIFSALLLATLFLLIGYFNFGKNPPSYRFFGIAGLSLAIIAGAFYSLGYSEYKKANENIVFLKKISFQAVIVDYPERSDYQDLILSLRPPYEGKVSARLPLYPEFDYGDLVNLEGIIEKPEPGGYADYLKKEGISGMVGFPKAVLSAKNQGSRIKFILYSFKKRFIRAFEKNLPMEESNLLGGLTLGERAGFSKEFKEAMKNSGTTHLVALSGYNISILVMATMAALGYFLKRRYSFIATVLIIIIFVLMTGGEASVVRAAVMGSILLLAGEAGRIYSLRNAIILTAFFMVLFNPEILRFDAGFQLSFLALLGIIYLSPALKNIFKAKEGTGILNWRENFWTTFSAQAAVLPILILNFGSFSFFSLISNVLILGFIPLTMGLGFILGFFGLIFEKLSFIFAWPAHIFLFYETSVIKFFGAKSGLAISSLGPVFVFIYCLILVILVFHGHKRIILKNNA